MKYVRPDYMDGFSCLMGACRHSCCIGWEIDVDAQSLARYRGVRGPIGQRLRENIEENENGASFRMAEDERCPFLNREGLCELILELGEDALCQICADHPRFRSFFSDREEIGLGLCCEAAGRLLLFRPEKTKLLEEGAEALTQDEEALLGLRREMISIMQDRRIPVEKRTERLLNAAELALDADLGAWAAFLLGLEQLEEAWAERLRALAEAGEIADLPRDDAVELAFEQLMVYLLYRHLPAALEDDDPAGHILYCVLMWRVIRALVAMEGFSAEAMVEICREYSAEIEYSDQNIGAILDELSGI